jgi:mannose/cellobiose epimerase-like protein (N-acyl-D-glucosamine 2-epimerase family)
VESLLSEPEAFLRTAGNDLSNWLANAAYPLWSTRGFDPVHGGFHESLGPDGEPAYEPRRIRVQARQVYSFARAPSFGWSGDAATLVEAGLAYIRTHYRRPDGLYRTLVAPDGAVLDDRALLYDQTFVLLALAESRKVLGPRPELVRAADALRDALYRHLKRPGGGFSSGVPEAVPLLANPHMHLLEATLAWAELDVDPAWRQFAEEIGALTLERMVDPATGAIREQFAADWTQLGSDVGPAVEPGHLFEWAWLLFRLSAGAPGAEALASCADRLVEIGETYGVHAGVGVMALFEDLTVRDGSARLWVQTERVKAFIYKAKRSGERSHWATAEAAVRALQRFLSTPMPGLWHDLLTDNGHFVPGRSPGSTFYHIVCAVSELASLR